MCCMPGHAPTLQMPEIYGIIVRYARAKAERLGTLRELYCCATPSDGMPFGTVLPLRRRISQPSVMQKSYLPIKFGFVNTNYFSSRWYLTTICSRNAKTSSELASSSLSKIKSRPGACWSKSTSKFKEIVAAAWTKWRKGQWRYEYRNPGNYFSAK